MIAENSMAGMKNLMTQKVDLRSKNVCGKIAIFRVQFPHSDFADSYFYFSESDSKVYKSHDATVILELLKWNDINIQNKVKYQLVFSVSNFKWRRNILTNIFVGTEQMTVLLLCKN